MILYCISGIMGIVSRALQQGPHEWSTFGLDSGRYHAGIRAAVRYGQQEHQPQSRQDNEGKTGQRRGRKQAGQTYRRKAVTMETLNNRESGDYKKSGTVFNDAQGRAPYSAAEPHRLQPESSSTI